MRLRLRHLSLPVAVAALILLAQMGLNIWQHVGDTRYFAWAPNDYLVTYDLRVDVGGRPLSTEEIRRRYRLDLTERLSESTKAKSGFAKVERYVFEDAPAELTDRIRWYEEKKGKNDSAHVRLVYQLDGGKEKTWLWPS
jgi:hypothetical protein